MADPVNSPLLSVSPAESSGAKGANAGNSAAKSAKSDDFSRVLDTQRARDTSSQRSANESSSVTDQTGKALPPEGNETAETPSKASVAAALDAAATNKDVIADADKTNMNPPQTTLAGDELASAAGGVSEDSASFNDSLAQESRTVSTADSKAGTVLESTLGVLNPASAQPGDALAKSALTDAEAAMVSNWASKNGLDSAIQATAGQAAAAVPASTRITPLSGLENLAGSASEVAASTGAIASPPSSNSASGTAPLSAAMPPLPPASTADDASLLATTFAAAPSAAALKESDVLAKAPVIGDTLSRGAGATAGERSALPPLDSGTPNRSAADWLRSGMGSEAAGQRGFADRQNDSRAELTGALGPAPRVDGSAPAVAASTVAGLTPTSSPASSALPAAAAPASAMPEYSLARAPDDTEFPGELSARMKTLVRDGVREARLNLHPAELGRLQVTVTTEGDQIKVAFTAETLAARDAIEQSMPRLREMLEQSGLQLAQSDVGQRDLQGNGERGGDGQSTAQPGVSEVSDADATVLVTAQLSNSRIDTYI